MRLLSALVLSLLLLINGAAAKGRSYSSRSRTSTTTRKRTVTARPKTTTPRSSSASNTAHKSTGDQRVSGYTRKDGKRVNSYMRSGPNGTQKDNFSTKGNVNRYTGKKGTKPAKK
jgi:hypothetical protein